MDRLPVQLSVVIPCFNEQEVLPETVARLERLLADLQRRRMVTASSRICLIDDGSRDRTWEQIERFAARTGCVVGVKLSRNRGHQNALLAGLFTAEGDAIVSVDADLQDDLGAIEKMLDAYDRGAEVVYGVRRDRTSDSWFKRATAEAFYRLMSAMGAQTVFNHADYRLLSRRAVDALRSYREVNLYLRGVVPLIGYQSAVVEYERSPRFAGESKYPLKKMVGLAIDAVTSFSVFPLRMISAMGFIVSAASLCVTLWVLWVALFSSRGVPGWASTVLPIYFLGGVQLLAIGVIGEYVGKVYMEVKARPRFFIDRVCGPAGPAVERAAMEHTEMQ